MALVTADSGEPTLLNNMIQHTDSKMHLYTNNFTPVQSMTTGSFTEATFSGATAVTLTGTSWNTASEVSNAAIATYATQTWTKSDSGSVTVQGYFVTTTDNATVLWAELFDTPRTLGIGDSLQISPQMSLQSAN